MLRFFARILFILVLIVFDDSKVVWAKDDFGLISSGWKMISRFFMDPQNDDENDDRHHEEEQNSENSEASTVDAESENSSIGGEKDSPSGNNDGKGTTGNASAVPLAKNQKKKAKIRRKVHFVAIQKPPPSKDDKNPFILSLGSQSGEKNLPKKDSHPSSRPDSDAAVDTETDDEETGEGADVSPRALLLPSAEAAVEELGDPKKPKSSPKSPIGARSGKINDTILNDDVNPTSPH